MARFSDIRIPANPPKTAPSVAALASIFLWTAASGLAADVTPDRLVNADKEPQNWLMNHRTYDGQRFSPLDRINKRQGNAQLTQRRDCRIAARRLSKGVIA
jgi:glucose dehydrogenase